jgi:hypothetical protein
MSVNIYYGWMLQVILRKAGDVITINILGYSESPISRVIGSYGQPD